MKIEKTALPPVPDDEAFALVTELDRLRRWLAVSAASTFVQVESSAER